MLQSPPNTKQVPKMRPFLVLLLAAFAFTGCVQPYDDFSGGPHGDTTVVPTDLADSRLREGASRIELVEAVDIQVLPPDMAPEIPVASDIDIHGDIELPDADDAVDAADADSVDVCASDCDGSECGDGVCSPDETCENCPDDCGCAEGDVCVDAACCSPNCDAKKCGSDGCGGLCGDCTGLQEECVDGLCVCQPACQPWNCGPDGCGGGCGQCGKHEECISTPAGWRCTSAMVPVPAGNFWMGCNNCAGSTVNDASCADDEYPYHEVYLDAYEIDKTEVTADHYAACESAGGCTPAGTQDPTCTWQKVGMGDHPINCATWDQVGEYCSWAGKRLCTEAEWEKAARGDCEKNGGPSNCKAQSRKYPWEEGTPGCELAVMNECDGDTQNVCSCSPKGDSPYGLCDMAGNVWEWVSDGYQKDYYCADPAAADYPDCQQCSWPGSPQPWANPPGPVDCSIRVYRGGSFGSFAAPLRVSERLYYDSSGSFGTLGGRCCRVP